MKRNSVFAVILACVLCLITGCTSTSNVTPPTIEPTPVLTVQPTESPNETPVSEFQAKGGRPKYRNNAP